MKQPNNTEISKAVETTARVGYAARGLIYFIIGLLAILLAFGTGGKTTDMQGAIAAIGNQPFGKILLWAVLIGLVCYSLWGFVRAIFNPFHKANDAKGIAERVGYLISGIAYALLILPTFALVTGGAKPAAGGAQGSQIQNVVSQVLAWPMGQWLVGIAGIAVIAIGCYQVFQGFSRKFDEQLNLPKLPPARLKNIRFLGRFGMVSRGILLAIIGIFLVIAAYQFNSSQAKGLDSALLTLMHQPYGPWLLGIIALGLMSLGIYSVFLTIYLRLKKI